MWPKTSCVAGRGLDGGVIEEPDIVGEEVPIAKPIGEKCCDLLGEDVTELGVLGVGEQNIVKTAEGLCSVRVEGLRLGVLGATLL
jgi:hypothetical protein